MSDDYAHRRHPGSAIVTEDDRQDAIRKIKSLIEFANRSYAETGLPMPTNVEASLSQSALYDDVTTAASEQQRERADVAATLNEEQRDFFDRVMASVRDNTGALFSVQALGGAGKTYVLNLLLQATRAEGMVAMASAFSGIASLLFRGGRTVHTTFGIPVPCGLASTSSIGANTERAGVLKETSLIVVDEVAMAPHLNLDCASRAVSDFRKDDRPFGGCTIVFSGDLRQLLPVIPRGSIADTVASCCFNAQFWPSVQQLTLRVNERIRQRLRHASSDDELAAARRAADYANYLLWVGEGHVSSDVPHGYTRKSVRLLDDIVLHGGVRDLVRWVYGDIPSNFHDMDFMSDRAILTPLNATVRLINTMVLDLLPDTTPPSYTVLKSVDTVEDGQGAYPVEYLNTLNPSGLPPHELHVKTGAMIILLRNLDHNGGLCNGTRLRVISVSNNLMRATIATGAQRGTHTLLPRIVLSPSDTRMPFKLNRRQFPVMLAFAMSINKSQGQTLGRDGVYLPKPVFSHGQLYTALSRVGSPDDIRILVENTEVHGTHPTLGTFTDNVVYSDVFDQGNVTLLASGAPPQHRPQQPTNENNPPPRPPRPPRPPPPASRGGMWGRRSDATASWLLVPIFRRALGYDPPSVVYPAQAFIPPRVWSAAVTAFTSRFDVLGFSPATINANPATGYISAADQDTLLAVLPPFHVLHTWLGACADLNRAQSHTSPQLIVAQIDDLAAIGSYPPL